MVLTLGNVVTTVHSVVIKFINRYCLPFTPIRTVFARVGLFSDSGERLPEPRDCQDVFSPRPVGLGEGSSDFSCGLACGSAVSTASDNCEELSCRARAGAATS
jgi:hypothetical protein